jgi:hypothetical protein
MFSFSMDKNVRFDVRGKQLAQQAIGEDRELEQFLRDNGGYRDDELYFRAENAQPKTLQDAIAFVQGIFFHPPNRIWLGHEAEALEVTDEDVAGARKPVT